MERNDTPNPIYERRVNLVLKCLTDLVIKECRTNGVAADSWEAGVRDEIHFWWGVIEERLRAPNKADFLHLIQRNRPFSFPELLPRFKSKKIRALDVGSAIFERIGQKADGYEISVTAADPLASAYNHLLSLHNLVPEHSIVWGVAEKVQELYGSNVWDFIHASNSLDHGYDPSRAFQQIAGALKSGGIAQFHHYVNEAQNQNYHGFHQWNIMSEDNNLIVWNLDSRNVITADMLGVQIKVVKGTKNKLSGKPYETIDVTFMK